MRRQSSIRQKCLGTKLSFAALFFYTTHVDTTGLDVLNIWAKYPKMQNKEDKLFSSFLILMSQKNPCSLRRRVVRACLCLQGHWPKQKLRDIKEDFVGKRETCKKKKKSLLVQMSGIRAVESSSKSAFPTEQFWISLRGWIKIYVRSFYFILTAQNSYNWDCLLWYTRWSMTTRYI